MNCRKRKKKIINRFSVWENKRQIVWEFSSDGKTNQNSLKQTFIGNISQSTMLKIKNQSFKKKAAKQLGDFLCGNSKNSPHWKEQKEEH